jgi:hypothetical protein
MVHITNVSTVADIDNLKEEKTFETLTDIKL